MTATPAPDDFAQFAASLAFWTGPVSFEPLGGGITNTNFIARQGRATYVVRIGGDIPVHHVSRANELAASRAAEAAGVSPKVLHAEPGAMVLQYVEGHTFAPEDVRDPRNRSALVDLIRRCHTEIPKYLRGSAAIFWVFHVLRDYAHTLREIGSKHVSLLPSLLAEADYLRDAVGPVDIVFGHNDLLAGNILDDGKRLWLIDWDYAGFNSPLFDLGGLSSNSELDDDARRDLIETYFQKPMSDALHRQFAAMTAASLLRETMWSMVSENHSTLDFDYVAYTAENLNRYRLAFEAFTHLD